MKKPIDWVIEDLESKRRVPIPVGVKDFKNRDRLDSIISKKNLEALNLFFDKPENFNFESLEFLNEELKKDRKVSQDDIDFIQNLVKEIKKYGGIEQPLTNSVGSFLQIEETFSGVDLTTLPKRIRIALLLWSYLTVIESCISDLSEIFYKIARGKNDQKYITLYEGSLERGEHPMFGQLRRTALRWNLVKPQHITFLTSNNLRDYIAHANLYYDGERDKILLPHGEELTLKKFEEEYVRIHDFFKELIFRINDNNADIKSTADKLRKVLAREYLKLVRSGGTKKLWRSHNKLPWEKE